MARSGRETLIGIGVVAILYGLFLLISAKRLADHPYDGSIWSAFYRMTEQEIRQDGWRSIGVGLLCFVVHAALAYWFNIEV